MDLSDVTALIERKCREEYARGYRDAIANIMSAAHQRAPEDIPPSGLVAATPDTKADEAKVHHRSRNRERDELVATTIERAPTGLMQSDIREKLAEQGIDIAVSSLGVILRRLVAQGRITKSGRVFAPATKSSEPDEDDGLPAPSSGPEPTKENDDAAALMSFE